MRIVNPLSLVVLVLHGAITAAPQFRSIAPLHYGGPSTGFQSYCPAPGGGWAVLAGGVLYKSNPEGKTWSLHGMPPPGSKVEFGHIIIPTREGGYAIAGYMKPGPGDFFKRGMLLVLDSTANVLWRAYIEAPMSGPVHGLVQAPDGGFVMSSEGGNIGILAQLIKYDASGNHLWSRDYVEPGYSYGRSVKATPDGGYLVAVERQSGSAQVVKTDGEGYVQWSRNYPFQETGAFDVAPTRDGGFAVIGYGRYIEPWNGGKDAILLKADAGRLTRWHQTFGGEFDETGVGVVEVEDGLVGLAHSFVTGVGPTLFKTDLDGNLLWTLGGPSARMSWKPAGEGLRRAPVHDMGGGRPGVCLLDAPYVKCGTIEDIVP